MPEATYKQEAHIINYTVTAAVTAGQVVQLPDGRAGVAVDAYAAGALGAYQVSGIAEVAKTTTMVMIVGSELYWDASADKAHLLHANDKDFFLGTCVVDATSAGTTVLVNLNQRPAATASFAHGFVAVPVQTAGFPQAAGAGGDAASLILQAANEAQKADALSQRKWAVGAKGTAHFLVNAVSNGSTSAVDLNVGIANATHATDADSITEHIFVHVDGGATTLLVQSLDGTTTNAAATTTLSLTAGTPFLFQVDFRTNSDCYAYINGVRVMDGTTGALKVLDLSHATGPLGLLAHAEKTAATSTGNFVVRAFAVTFDPGTAA